MLDSIVKTPEDGFTSFEKIILKDLVLSIYKSLRNTREQFMLCMIFECKYSQAEVAEILGCTQANVSKKMNIILQNLREKKKKNLL
jgi:DNA-directed RNA polymerase specialized sigma subunit